MITLANIRRAIYNILKRLSILERGGGGSSTPIDISGKQDVIDSTHKLASDLVDDSNLSNKFVTSLEKDTWNGKSDFSGDYDDLSNKPTLFSGSYNDLSNKPTLFSGDYDDLSNKPNLFDGSYNSLSNKPTLFSGNYEDLSNKPTIPSIWIGTQIEYDAIVTKDSDTIYIIK